MLGNGSYCYYLTVLMALYVLFVFIPIMRMNSVLFLCEIVTIISATCFSDIGGINPSLNILNWIGYFALGVQISKNRNLWDRIKQGVLNNSILCLFISTGVYLLFLIYQLYNLKGGSYWGGINVIGCWLGAIVVVSLSFHIEKRKVITFASIIHQIGMDSFAIYIWHMPFAGIVARIMNTGFLSYLVIIRPFLVLCITMLFICLIRKLIPHSVYRYMGIRKMRRCR